MTVSKIWVVPTKIYCITQNQPFKNFYMFFKKIFIYLFGCTGCQLWQAGSLVVACELLAVACKLLVVACKLLVAACMWDLVP